MNTPFEELMHTFCAGNDARIKSCIYIYIGCIAHYQIDNLTYFIYGYFNTENFRKRQHLSIQKLGIIGIGYEE